MREAHAAQVAGRRSIQDRRVPWRLSAQVGLPLETSARPSRRSVRPAPRRARGAPLMSGPSPCQATLTSLKRSEHGRCLLCGQESLSGMKLAFSVQTDRSVLATFHCERLLQGYPGMLHGGLTSAVLDAAMTNALFAIGVGRCHGRAHGPVPGPGEARSHSDGSCLGRPLPATSPALSGGSAGPGRKPVRTRLGQVPRAIPRVAG